VLELPKVRLLIISDSVSAFAPYRMSSLHASQHHISPS
jgi:hypothetical protein